MEPSDEIVFLDIIFNYTVSLNLYVFLGILLLVRSTHTAKKRLLQVMHFFYYAYQAMLFSGCFVVCPIRWR